MLNKTPNLQSPKFRAIFSYFHILNSEVFLNTFLDVLHSQKHLFIDIDDEVVYDAIITVIVLYNQRLQKLGKKTRILRRAESLADDTRPP